MKILLIDEDKASMAYYIQELKESGFEVDHAREPDAAFKFLDAGGTKYELIILDSALPPGQKYKEGKTDTGTVTGGLVFDDVRVQLPTVPILVLTNFPELDWIREARAKPNVVVVKKLDQMPSQLVETVREMVRNRKKG
jgi:DNA-binding response OmpR family regulator